VLRQEVCRSPGHGDPALSRFEKEGVGFPRRRRYHLVETVHGHEAAVEAAPADDSKYWVPAGVWRYGQSQLERAKRRPPGPDVAIPKPFTARYTSPCSLRAKLVRKGDQAPMLNGKVRHNECVGL
jgi:hypothetical protein